jgi:ceramide glucosyltransferase
VNLLLDAGSVFLIVAIFPLIYYLLAVHSCWRYFRVERTQPKKLSVFTPPVSNLKPVRGLDPDAYENFASFCRQDYPEYELLFCVDESDQAAQDVIAKLQRNFPQRSIRVLIGSGRSATNDKVAKLARLAAEARYEHLVISDSDVRVRPDYLREVVAPLADARTGAVTCFYVSPDHHTLANRLQSVGMLSDFYAGILVAWQLDGIKFALGPTIATTRAHLAGFGGYAAIENRPADDLLVGRLIADQGLEVKLLPYTLETVDDYHSLRELIHKRLRWIVVMRHMRPWGHFGLLFTQGLFWAILAVALHPSLAAAAGYFGAYLALRFLMTWTIGVWGLRQKPEWLQFAMIPLWDALACGIWLASFTRRSLRWRGEDYRIDNNGILVPVAASAPAE